MNQSKNEIRHILERMTMQTLSTDGGHALTQELLLGMTEIMLIMDEKIEKLERMVATPGRN